VTSAFLLHRYTYQDYVAGAKHDRATSSAGEIVAMAGGTFEHAAMAAEITRQSRPAARGRAAYLRPISESG
jgi:hypothetical protein